MRPAPASKFLTDITRKQDSVSAPDKPAQGSQGAEPQPLQLFAVHDRNTTQHRIAEAHARGFAEGLGVAEEEAQAKLEEMRQFYEKKLEVERLTWASREADRLSEQLTSALQRIEVMIGDSVAEILKPFLKGAAHRRAVGELLKAIETVLGNDQGVALEICGPEDLLQMMRDKLSGKTIGLVFTPSEGPEVRVIAGQTVMETQLQAWVEKIEEALR